MSPISNISVALWCKTEHGKIGDHGKDEYDHDLAPIVITCSEGDGDGDDDDDGDYDFAPAA